MKLKTIMRIILTPRCWGRNYKTSKNLDNWLKRALLIPTITEIGRHTCKLDGKLLYNDKTLALVYQGFESLKEARKCLSDEVVLSIINHRELDIARANKRMDLRKFEKETR